LTQPTERGRCLVLLPRVSWFTDECPSSDIDLGISGDECGDVPARTRDCRYADQRVCGLELVSVGGFLALLIGLSFKPSSDSMFMNGISSSGLHFGALSFETTTQNIYIIIYQIWNRDKHRPDGIINRNTENVFYFFINGTRMEHSYVRDHLHKYLFPLAVISDFL
jgi:hypothetical protein